ncbi:MAG: glycosyltransferase family 4 protein, partial [Mesorhizobium sp.]
MADTLRIVHCFRSPVGGIFRHVRDLTEAQVAAGHAVGHGAKGGAYARLFGSLLRVSRSRVARLYSPHGGSLHYDETTATGKLFFALERFMARFTDYLLFVSDYERQTYHRKVGEPPIPNNLVYNGLSAAEFEPVRTEQNAADVLYIGMMRDLKG